MSKIKTQNVLNMQFYLLCILKNVSHYTKYFNILDWTGIIFPITLDETTFKKFEQKNPNIPALNVHILENYNDETPKPFYCSVKGNVNAENAINLLYYYTNPVNGHFIWMKHPTRVFARITKHKEKKYIYAR